MPPSNSDTPSSSGTQRPLGQDGFARSVRMDCLVGSDAFSKLAFSYLWTQLEALLTEELRARAGVDPEGVHQMRVATRRVRALLDAFRKLADLKSFVQLAPEFKWLARQLGAVRDLDVYLESIRRYSEDFSEAYRPGLKQYVRFIEAERRTAHRELLSGLSSQRYQQLLQTYASLLEPAPNSEKYQTLTIAEAAENWIGKQFRKLIRDGRSIEHGSPDTKLHELRIDCKRLRYLLELFKPVYGLTLKATIRRLKGLQDTLGLVQDAHVFTVRLENYARELAPTEENKLSLIAIGQLMCMQHQQIKEQREIFFELWPKFDQKGARRKLLAELRA